MDCRVQGRPSTRVLFEPTHTPLLFFYWHLVLMRTEGQRQSLRAHMPWRALSVRGFKAARQHGTFSSRWLKETQR